MTEREMKPPSDRDLTEKGLPLAPQTGRILLIACGALAREILDLKEANGWSHLDLTCLPAKLHLYPEKITDEVRAAVKKHRDTYDDIFVVYADCGTGGLNQLAAIHRFHRHYPLAFDFSPAATAISDRGGGSPNQAFSGESPARS